MGGAQVRLRSEKKPGVAGCGAASPASPGTRANCCVFLSTQDSFPARFGGVHFVNQPWYIHALYTLIKPFLKDKTRKRIFLHGNNLNSLHQLIHPEFLPSEFGGTLPPYDMGTWARTLLGPDYSDENDYTHTSYNTMHVKHTSSSLERECSPKPMKRSQSVVEAGTLKHEEKGENENTQPLLALD
nr:clavesin-1 [Manis javanica]